MIAPATYFTLYGRDEHLLAHFGLSLLKKFRPDRPPSNVINFEFEDSHLESGEITMMNLKEIIQQLQPIFKIDSARLTVLEDRRPKAESIHLPNGKRFTPTIGWMSYFGKDIVDYIGRERFENLQTYEEKEEIEGGFFIVLQKEPFRRSEESHLQREGQALAELGFESDL